MKKFLYKGKVWNLAGYHVDGDVLIWRKGFDGHSGIACGGIGHDVDPEARGHCWWVRNEDLKPYVEMEENE